MYIIGLTGGTGCGKTTALRCIERRGGVALDCDAIYHELLAHDADLLQAITDSFPESLVNGVFVRKELGKLVFADPQKLKELTAITGRYINRAVDQRLEAAKAAGGTLAAIDAIGLLEGNLVNRCDTTIAVVAPEEARVQRLLQRENITEAYARARIRAQKSEEYFAQRCDHILRNDCPTKEAFEARCDALLDTILKG